LLQDVFGYTENMKRDTFTREQFKDHPFLSRLLHLHDVPDQIHVAGNLPEVSIDSYGRATPRILTVVGSRDHSQYGKDALEHLLGGLAGYPVIILSGLAIGIDTLAHKNALTHRLTTLAIPGSGIHPQVLYPKSNATLADHILESGGAILSELDPLEEAAQWTFPARNRLMAALSDAVLIVEAQESSGTLITARQALELGRDIGAIPGSIFNTGSTGTHNLIREGATPITSASDLLELLHLEHKGDRTMPLPELTREEKKLYDMLANPQPKSQLLIASELTPQAFMVAITTLELKGLIKISLNEIRRVV